MIISRFLFEPDLYTDMYGMRIAISILCKKLVSIHACTIILTIQDTTCIGTHKIKMKTGRYRVTVSQDHIMSKYTLVPAYSYYTEREKGRLHQQ